jgi:Bacterial protein of unknown function (DUF937)
MGLFDQILGAIENPNQQANPSQIGSIVNVVEQLASTHNVDSSMTQTVMSVVGGYVRSALQQQATTGVAQPAAIVEQYGSTNPSMAAVQALFTPQQQQQVTQEVAQKTGLNLGTIEAMLPVIVPIVLNLLKTGASTQPAGSTQASNSVLSSFLDADSNGAVDIGDAISIASRFLTQRR